MLSGDHTDGTSLRLLGIAAAFLAAWLAGRVEGRAALRGEDYLTGDRDNLPAPVKVASYAASSVAYPLVYIPFAWWLASQLEKHGVRGARAVPKSALLSWVSYHAVKTMVHRERPPDEQGDANDDRSYPSGHATAAAAIALSAAYLWLRQDPPARSRVLPLAMTAPVLVGASRVVLGKHWPSDVIGGLTTGVAVAASVTAGVASVTRTNGATDAREA